jgi:hypothetical protein
MVYGISEDSLICLNLTGGKKGVNLAKKRCENRIFLYIYIYIYIYIYLFIYLFIFFQFCSQIDHHSQNILAKFGHRLNIILKIFLKFWLPAGGACCRKIWELEIFVLE